MRKLFLILCIVCAIFSCKKKDDPVEVKSPWVAVNTSLNTGGTMNVVQDTLLYLLQYSNSQDILMCSFDDNLTPRFTSYRSGYDMSTSLIVNGNDVYIGTRNGIYRSENCCRSWEQKSFGLPTDIEIGGIEGTGVGVYVYGNRAYFSSDRGDHWTDISITDMYRTTDIVAVGNTLITRANTTANSVYALYASEDNGANWVLVNPSPSIVNLPMNITVMNDVLYAVVYENGEDNIYVSSDKGRNWIKGEGIHVYGENYTSDFEYYNGIVYAATEDGVFQSSDNGKNWVRSGCYDVVSLVRRNNVLYASTRTQGIWKMQL